MTREYLVVPVEWKVSGADENTLEGYASTFGNVDLGGDVVERGAFTKTIKERVSSGQVKLLADHMAMTDSVIGTVVSGKENDHGLLIQAKISTAPSAQDLKIKMIEGHINTMSIGYSAVKWSMESDEAKGTDIRHLEEIKLYEVSVVVFPMNPEATIQRVKSMVSRKMDTTTRDALLSDINTLRDEIANAEIVDLTDEKDETEGTAPEVEQSSDSEVTGDQENHLENSAAGATSDEPNPHEKIVPESLAVKMAHADAALKGRASGDVAVSRIIGGNTARLDFLSKWLENATAVKEN